MNGKLVFSAGGGLCQLSSLLYHLSLLAGLEILERHAHSVDIYQEEERFTPLGADATVSFPYRDLRIRNTFNCPIRFTIDLEEESIRGHLIF